MYAFKIKSNVQKDWFMPPPPIPKLHYDITSPVSLFIYLIMSFGGTLTNVRQH